MRHYSTAIHRLAYLLIISLVLLAGNASAHVALLAPNGGEELEAGDVFTVRWQVLVQHDTQNWDLWYSTSGADGPWIPIAMDLAAGDTSQNAIHTYNWTIPEAFSGQCRVRVRQDNGGTDYEDISDADFSITGLSSVSVDNFAITTGILKSGGLSDLLESDNQYLVMDPVFSMFRYQLVYTVDGISPTDTPTGLEFNYEAKTFNIVGPVGQTIELFNYESGQFETVDTRNATPTDSIVTIAPTGNPIRFVESGTGSMRARISYVNHFGFGVLDTTTLYTAFKTSVDHIFWNVGQ